MQEYIIDLKQTSIYKAANFWFDINGQNTCKFWWQTLNIQILKTLPKDRISWNLSVSNIILYINLIWNKNENYRLKGDNAW